MPIGSRYAYPIYRSRCECIMEPAVKGLLVGGDQPLCRVGVGLAIKTGWIARDQVGRRLQRTARRVAPEAPDRHGASTSPWEK
jgi:hypothetical protein